MPVMFESKGKPHEHVIDQGDDGDNFDVTEQGLYGIVVALRGMQQILPSMLLPNISLPKYEQVVRNV